MPIRAGSNASASAARTAPTLPEPAAGEPHPHRIARIAAGFAGLARWRRFGAAVLLGAIASLSVPPLYAVPLLWIAFPGLYWLLASAHGNRSAFLTGWAFGFGFFVPGLYWVSWALTVDPRFFWLIPFAMAGLPALLGLFTGLAGLAFHRLNRVGCGGPLALAATWALAEWLRGHVLTGFPWNLIGYGWVGWLPVLQGASVVGIYGLSLLTVAAATLPATLAGPRRRGLVASAAGIALFVAIAAWGGWRLAGDDGAVVPGVTLRLVQPNISQTDKWSGEKMRENFRLQLQMSQAAGLDKVSAVIWSETAVPGVLSWDPGAQQALGAILPPGALALVGAVRAVPYGSEPLEIWNSVFAIDHTGAVLSTYDKAHLVPFGEYVPFHALLAKFGVEKITAGSIDFTAGPGPQTLALPGLPPVSPMVCYEAIFPGEVLDPAGARPGWMLNVTNDGWYGLTSGPHQHFAIALTRAVEEGLPLVRAANTGVSGVVDAYGRVKGEIALGEQGILDAALPAALPATPYACWGEAGFWLLLLAGLLAGRAWRTAPRP